MRWNMATTAVLAFAFIRPEAAFAPAHAEVAQIRSAQQFSMGYPRFNVMKHQGLLEKHVAEQGLPPVKVTWVTFNGPDMMNDALLSGAVDIASGGMPGLLTIWAKTKGTAQDVRGDVAAAATIWTGVEYPPERKPAPFGNWPFKGSTHSEM